MTHRILGTLRAVGIAMMVVATSALAQSEQLKQYFAIRDAFQPRIPAWPSDTDTKIDWHRLHLAEDSVLRRLEPLARSIVGPFNVPGFTQPGAYNVMTFLPGDVAGGLADGISYYSPRDSISVVVSTPELLRKWNGKDPIATLGDRGELLGFSQREAAIVPYAVIPPFRPSVILALLIARQQDIMRGEYGNRIILSLRRRGQLVVAEFPSPVNIKVPSCERWWLKKASELQPPPAPGDTIFREMDDEDAAYRICYSREVVKDPRWPQIVSRAEQVSALILR